MLNNKTFMEQGHMTVISNFDIINLNVVVFNINSPNDYCDVS